MATDTQSKVISELRARGERDAGGSTDGGTDCAPEGSNVDIAAEFSNLIVAQRAFEANAKAVTTFDTVTQDTINLVH